jgi:hypothetical protein
MEEVCKLGRPTLLCSTEAVSLCTWITTKFMQLIQQSTLHTFI